MCLKTCPHIAIMSSWWWWCHQVVLIPPFWALDVTVLTLVTFLEWNDLNKVKDDGKKHRTGRWEGAVVMKWNDIKLCSGLTFVSSHQRPPPVPLTLLLHTSRELHASPPDLKSHNFTKPPFNSTSSSPFIQQHLKFHLNLVASVLESHLPKSPAVKILIINSNKHCGKRCLLIPSQAPQ